MVRLSTRCTRAVSKQTPGPLGVLWAVISTGKHIRHDAKPRVELSHTGFARDGFKEAGLGLPGLWPARDGHLDELFGSNADSSHVKNVSLTPGIEESKYFSLPAPSLDLPCRTFLFFLELVRTNLSRVGHLYIEKECHFPD